MRKRHTKASGLFLGYVPLGFGGWSFREKVEFARKNGLGSLSLDFYETLQHKTAEKQDLRKILTDNDVMVGTLRAPIQILQIRLRDQTIENCRRSCELAHSLDCRVLSITTVLPETVDIPEPELWKNMTELCRAACEICRGERISLAVEVHRHAVVQNLERMERLLDCVNHPNLWVDFNPANLHMAGSDPVMTVRRLGSKIKTGSIKDGIYKSNIEFFDGSFNKPNVRIENGCFNTSHIVPLGAGEVNYPAVFKAMRRGNIYVPMHIEHVAWPEQVVEAADYIRGVWEAAAS